MQINSTIKSDLFISKIDEFEFKWATIALFGSIVSLFISVEYCFLRLGLPTPFEPIISAISIVFSASFSPLLIPTKWIKRNPEIKTLLYPMISISILASVLLSLVIGNKLYYLYIILSITSLAKSLRFLLLANLRKLTILIVGGAITGHWLLSIVNSLGYAGVYTPEQGVLGLLNHDTRFHTSIAYMIQNFRIPSLAVDGILPITYHFGSHYWFAAFGLLTNSQPLWSYGTVVSIVCAPMLLLSLLLSGFCINGGKSPVSFHIVSGIILLFISNLLGWTSYFISESYNFSLITMLLSLPLFAYFSGKNLNILNQVIVLIVCILLTPILMSLKVSVGILWGGGICWIALRKFSLSRYFLISCILTGLCILLSLRSFSPPAGGLKIIPFYFFRSYPLTSTFSSFVFPICLIFLSLYDKKIPLIKIFSSKADLLLESILAITLVGTLPGMLGIPEDSSDWYFLNVGAWFALPVLLSRLTLHDFYTFLLNTLQTRIGRPILVLFATIFIALNLFYLTNDSSFGMTIKSLLQAASKQGSGFMNGISNSDFIIKSIQTEHVLFGHKFAESLRDSIGERIIFAVRSALPKPMKDVAVFIPPQNKVVWSFQTFCDDKYNVQTSLTGYPSLLGGVPKEYNCPPGMGNLFYSTYGNNIHSRNLNDSEICKHALSRHIKIVFVLYDIYDQRRNRILHCNRLKP